MPSSLNKRVRARRLKTGENWQTAERHVRAEGQRARAEASAPAAPPPVADDSAHDEEHAAVADDGADDKEYEAVADDGAHDEEYEAVADRAPAGLVRDEDAEDDFDGDLETESAPRAPKPRSRRHGSRADSARLDTAPGSTR